MPVVRSMGYAAGSVVRGNAALRAVLQGPVVPLADRHADHVDHQPPGAARPAGASRAGPDPVHGHEHPRRLAQDRRLPGRARRGSHRLLDREQLPLLEERLVLRVHGQRVDRHRDRQPLPDGAGAGEPPLREPPPRRGGAVGRRQRRSRPAVHLVPQAAGGRLAVRQRHRADPGRRAGLRHADAADQRASARRTPISRPPTPPSCGPRWSGRRA